MTESLEKIIAKTISKSNLGQDEGFELIDNLYWADWDALNNKNREVVGKIFNYLKRDDLSNKEISKILKLYNNPDGSFIDEFSQIIINIYKRDKKRFLKSLNLEKEESTNLVYVFRTNNIKLDEDIELLRLIDSDELSEEEKDTAKQFIKMYEYICNS